MLHIFILFGAFDSGVNRYYVRMIVNEQEQALLVEDINVLYAMSTKKEPAVHRHLGLRSNTANPITGSTISISDFLENVKRFYGSVLSQDVYSEFQETRPILVKTFF